MRYAVVVGALALVLAGCGSAPIVVGNEPVPTPYDGPMHLPIDHSDEATVLARSGAAGRALECAGDPYNGGGADYDGGLESVQESPEKALENLFREEGFSAGMPTEGYRVERRDEHRVLLSYDVGTRTKAAYIVADGVRDWKHHTGWGVEAWAQCDPAEFPAELTDDLNLDIWTDAAGSRVPVTTVTSWSGPEHCGWQDITFLEVGSDPARFGGGDEYVRDVDGELADLLRGSYLARTQLPAEAVDTGWTNDGRRLWLVPGKTAAYLVSVRDAADVERWPASRTPIGCA